MNNNFMPYSYQNYNYGYQQPTRQMTIQPQFQMPVQQQQMAQMQAQPQMHQPIQQQPIQQPMQQSMTFDTPIQYVGYATLKEAEAYILMPNTKGLFIDKNNGMVYEKACGINGQSEIIYYKKVELNEDKKVTEETTINMPEFATKTDLKDFVTIEQHENLIDTINGLKGQINGLKTMLETKAEQPKKIKTENKTNKESE